MNFSAAHRAGGADPGLLRDGGYRKLPAFLAAQQLYEAAGAVLPEVVFWNLRPESEGAPVLATQPGAMLVSPPQSIAF